MSLRKKAPGNGGTGRSLPNFWDLGGTFAQCCRGEVEALTIWCGNEGWNNHPTEGKSS